MSSLCQQTFYNSKTHEIHILRNTDIIILKTELTNTLFKRYFVLSTKCNTVLTNSYSKTKHLWKYNKNCRFYRGLKINPTYTWYVLLVNVKVILYSYLILKKMNERITVNISTNIHKECIKTKYIPSYFFENEGKIFKKLKKLAVF